MTASNHSDVPITQRNTWWHPAGGTRRVLRWVRGLIWALLLPLLLLAGFTQWWLLPHLNDYRDELAQTLSAILRKPVRIEALTATIEGGQLALQLRGIRIDEPDRDVTLAQFARVSVTLNLSRSLQEWRPVVRRIRLEGASLTIGSETFDLPQLLTQAEGTATFPTAHWLLDLHELDIVGEQLAVRLTQDASLQLRHPYLHLHETPQGPRLEFTADLPTPLGDHVEMAVEQMPNNEGWQWQGRIYTKNLLNPAALPAEFTVTRATTGWQTTLRHWRAEQLLAWATPWLEASAQQWLLPLKPHGALPDIQVQSGAGVATTVTATFRDLSTQPVHGLPGFTQMTGEIHFTTTQGRIALDSHAVRVDTAGLFRAPITLDTLQGTLHWQRQAEGLQLETDGLDLINPDLKSRFWGRLMIPDVGKPWLDLQGRYQDVKVARARHYLPVAVIPPEGVAWLDRALVSGRVRSGTMTLRGPPAAFPFDRNEGLFETRFFVEDAVLDYAPGWPRLERLKTEVLFRNRGLVIETDRAYLLDGELENATTRIDDLSEVVVQVKGRAKGPAASMWRALKDSPFGQELGNDLPDLQATGISTLDLDLTLPTDERPNQARGRIGLLDNQFTLPAWKIVLERLRGEVQFTETGLEARNVRAQWRGEPIRLDMDLTGRDNRRALRTQIRGRLGWSALTGTPANTPSRITGKSDWNAVLTIPTGQESRNSSPVFQLDLRSDLRGIALNGPEPFTKTASTTQPLHITVQPIAVNRLTANLTYGEEVRARLALRGSLDALQLERGELRIGAGEAQLPDQPGLTIVAELPRWTWSQSSSAQPTEGWDSRLLRSVNARLGELNLAGQTFATVTVNALRYAEGLQVELESASLAGRLTIPDQPTPEQPINATLQRLHVRYPSDIAAPDTPAKPEQWQPLVFTVNQFRVNARDLGRLHLTAVPDAHGVRLTDMALSSARQHLTANGAWQWHGTTATSQIKATLDSPELGATLADFGYPDVGIARGATEAELAVQWPGALPDFAVERIAGTLTFQVGPGRLLEINPGLGRMIGLFNVQNLTRRLSLDFSDLFQPGASFDRIVGSLTFRHGQAQTEHFTIEAPAARVEVRGRIGLQDRDYDQHITVTPHLGGTLPIAGALAGGPVTGAAMFVAEQLLRKGIEQATRYHYRLHGSWDDPILEPLVERTPPNAPRQGFTNDN